MRRDINRVEENVLELGSAIAAQDANRVVDVARVNRIALFQQAVKLSDNLAGEFHLKRIAIDFNGGAANPDPDAARMVRGLDMLIVLSQKITEKTWIGEFEMVGLEVGYGAGRRLLLVCHMLSSL